MYYSLRSRLSFGISSEQTAIIGMLLDAASFSFPPQTVRSPFVSRIHVHSLSGLSLMFRLNSRQQDSRSLVSLAIVRSNPDFKAADCLSIKHAAYLQ